MIRGVGLDVVHIDRMKKWSRTPGIFTRFFHPKELEDSESRGSSMHLSLAARFAAKEAFGKALGTGLAGIKLADIRVISNHNGKPDIKVYGTAAAALERSAGSILHVSLTHERDNALAMVILED